MEEEKVPDCTHIILLFKIDWGEILVAENTLAP